MILSYNEAIRIQSAQITWYRHSLGYKGVKKLRKDTLPCPADIHPDTPISVRLINNLVPRGGDIEYIIGNKHKQRPGSSDVDMAVHNAIRNGLM